MKLFFDLRQPFLKCLHIHCNTISERLNNLTNIQQLIQRVLDGQKKAANELYEAYKRPLFVVCLRYASDRSRAQDYLQEAFISIFKNLKQFDSSKGAFESWAKRVTINTCLMDLRKNTLYAVNISEAVQVESDMEDALSSMSLKEMLELIQQLPEGYKTVFNMYVIDGFSHREIAEKLGVSINTSKTQLMKARLLLQKKINLVQRIMLDQDHG